MKLLMLWQVGFISRCGYCEQAFQANRIERTVSISPVWKESWKCWNHRATLFSGENSNIQSLWQDRWSIQHTFCLYLLYPLWRLAVSDEVRWSKTAGKGNCEQCGSVPSSR